MCVDDAVKLVEHTNVRFLSRGSLLTRDIDVANMSVRSSVCPSVRPSVRNVPVADENGLTYRHRKRLNISS